MSANRPSDSSDLSAITYNYLFRKQFYVAFRNTLRAGRRKLVALRNSLPTSHAYSLDHETEEFPTQEKSISSFFEG